MKMSAEQVQELKVIVRKHRWAVEEMVLDQKMQEANTLMSGAPNAMYAYLVEKFGDGMSVLSCLRHLVIVQRGRRKTLGTIVDDTQTKKRRQG